MLPLKPELLVATATMLALEYQHNEQDAEHDRASTDASVRTAAAGTCLLGSSPPSRRGER